MWESFPIQLQGGLVTNMPSIQQGISMTGSARKLINFEPLTTSGYRRINGFSKFNNSVISASSARPNGIGFWGDKVIVFKDGDVIPYNPDGTIYDTNYGVYIYTSGKVRFKDTDFEPSLNPSSMFFGDGSHFGVIRNVTTAPLSFSSNVSLLNVSFGYKSYATQFKGHLFVSSESDLTFTAPYTFSLEPGDGAGEFSFQDDITGLHVFRETLIIFTQNSIHALSGNSVGDFNLQEITNKVGCVCGDTVQEVSGDVLFLARDGVRKLGTVGQIGDFSNFSVSQAIQKDMTNFVEDHESFSSCVVRNKSQYRLFGYKQSRSKASSRGWIGTQQQDGSFHWSETRGIKVYSCASKVLSDGTEKIVFTNDDNYVYEMDVGNDFDGESIQAFFYTPFFSINDPTLRKTVYKANLFFNLYSSVTGELQLVFDQRVLDKIQPEAIDISTSISSSPLYGSAIYGNSAYSESVNFNKEVQTIGTGFNVSLEFNFTETQDPFILDTIVLEYFTEGRK